MSPRNYHAKFSHNSQAINEWWIFSGQPQNKIEIDKKEYKKKNRFFNIFKKIRNKDFK